MRKLISAVAFAALFLAQIADAQIVQGTGGASAGGGSGTVTTITAGTNITLSSGATCTTTCTINATGGGAPGGSNTQLQYNNSGSLGGITGATTNGTAVTLTSPTLVTPALGT